MINPQIEKEKSGKSDLKSVIVFFLLAYAITWALFVPSLILHIVNQSVAYGSFYGPAIAAIIVTAYTSGKNGVRQLLGRYKIWRFRPHWYALAFFGIPAVVILSVFLSVSSFSFFLTGIGVPGAIVFFLGYMLINPGEEVGWRGFALPRIEKLTGSSLIASLVLGFIWGLWHIPVFIAGQESFPFPLFILFTVGISVLFTTLMNGAYGSLLAVTILHASTDAMNPLFKESLLPLGTWIDLVLLTWALSLAVFCVKGRSMHLPFQNIAKWRV